MSNLLKNLVGVVNNPDASIVDDGIESSDVGAYIDTGSYSLNALLSGSLYGGIPDNKIVSFASPEATGKTFFSMSMVKTFLDSNPDAICFYFDTESAVTKDMFVTRGIDAKRVAIIPVITVEQFRTQAVKLADSYLALNKSEKKPVMMVLDSLGMLSTSKEMADTAEGKDTKDMTRAQIIKATFRVLTLKLGRAHIPMIVCNHVYAKIGTMYPEVEASGGGGLKYAASTIVLLSKRKEKEEKDVVGNVIHCKTYKSRFSKENQQIDVLLRYDTGLNKYYGLVPLAEKYGIFKKVSTRYELPDGSKVFEKQLNDNPEKYFTKEVMDLLEIAVGKEFKYGNTQIQEDPTPTN